ncbi:YciI family protein [Nitrosococcus oceani]|uniref:YciI family protein n=1 Tax=Nitrosococcus oceani TaxID=1229 RepID=UPI0004E8EBC0|nr:YciI family protein [Nitrosococcus oceani]KFI21905.1 hypothetical protein HW44_12225 [Nitrosococcus oceani]
MLYAIIGQDIDHSLERRRQIRSEHLARIRKLQENGHLVLAGPFPALDTQDPGEAGFTGSLIVAEFSSLEAAQQWAEADPYVETGVYAQVTVKPFKQVLP